MSRGVATGTMLLVLLLGTACYSTTRLPLVPSSEARVVGDIRGVVFEEQAGGGRIGYSRVSEVRWTSSELIITATVTTRDDEGGVPRRRGQTMTTSFPLEDVSHVLIAEHRFKRLEILPGIAVGAFLGTVFFVIVALRDFT